MRKIVLVGLFIILTVFYVGCNKKPIVDGTYDFIIYESDSDNSDLSDNKIVAKYTIEYENCKVVTDTLIKKENNKYYFSKDSNDYLVLEDSGYGLTYTLGYFENYSECNGNNPIDVTWTYTAVNGKASNYGIAETALDELIEYGFVINGWK